MPPHTEHSVATLSTISTSPHSRANNDSTFAVHQVHQWYLTRQMHLDRQGGPKKGKSNLRNPSQALRSSDAGRSHNIEERNPAGSTPHERAIINHQGRAGEGEWGSVKAKPGEPNRTNNKKPIPHDPRWRNSTARNASKQAIAQRRNPSQDPIAILLRVARLHGRCDAATGAATSEFATPTLRCVCGEETSTVVW
jgi:hypothetical protein